MRTLQLLAFVGLILGTRECGVMTDTDLLVVAKRYFGLATPQK
jgi:hypothetical protein